MKLFPLILTSVSFAGISLNALSECDAQLQASTPSDRFVVQSNATVVDTQTGLMWKRCAQGFEWDGSICAEEPGTPTRFTWEEALVSHETHEFANYDDWRLPNKIELASIVEYSCFEPAINSTLFPGTASDSFWSNTPNAFNISFAWAINFSLGEHTTTRRTNPYGVRLVRDYPGQ